MIEDKLRNRQPLYFANPDLAPAAEVLPQLSIGAPELAGASARLERWAPALEHLFPELAASGGIIESPLLPLPEATAVLARPLPGRAFIKADHALPVAGSIKARGGIHEVLAYAERVAAAEGLATAAGGPLQLITPAARACFGHYAVGVGSTGNLGLSIGIMAATLGFKTAVHMSQDAKEWKKERLRRRGVTVVEHAGDYAAAVAAGRRELEADPRAHFVDDENSLDLFLGYAVAAQRLQPQLAAAGITVDAERPLFVYLPCGVGGAPGGISWGLKRIYGDAVHCFFAEPVDAPAFVARKLAGHPASAYDYGLSNHTEADGLAVATASELVHALTGRLVNGYATVLDAELYRTLARLDLHAGIRIEPSAAAGFMLPQRLAESHAGRVTDAADVAPEAITHLFWTTGGSFVPDIEYEHFRAIGRALLQAQA